MLEFDVKIFTLIIAIAILVGWIYFYVALSAICYDVKQLQKDFTALSLQLLNLDAATLNNRLVPPTRAVGSTIADGKFVPVLANYWDRKQREKANENKG